MLLQPTPAGSDPIKSSLFFMDPAPEVIGIARKMNHLKRNQENLTEKSQIGGKDADSVTKSRIINIAREIKDIFKEKEWSTRDYFFVFLGGSTATIVLKLLQWLAESLWKLKL